MQQGEEGGSCRGGGGGSGSGGGGGRSQEAQGTESEMVVGVHVREGRVRFDGSALGLGRRGGCAAIVTGEEVLERLGGRERSGQIPGVGSGGRGCGLGRGGEERLEGREDGEARFGREVREGGGARGYSLDLVVAADLEEREERIEDAGSGDRVVLLFVTAGIDRRPAGIKAADEFGGDGFEEEVDEAEGVDADRVFEGRQGGEGVEDDRWCAHLDERGAGELRGELVDELADEGADAGARVGDQVGERGGQSEQVLLNQVRVSGDEFEGFLEGLALDGGRVVAGLDEQLGEGQIAARGGFGALGAGGREGLGGEADALGGDRGVGSILGELLPLAEFQFRFLERGRGSVLVSCPG